MAKEVDLHENEIERILGYLEDLPDIDEWQVWDGHSEVMCGVTKNDPGQIVARNYVFEINPERIRMEDESKDMTDAQEKAYIMALTISEAPRQLKAALKEILLLRATQR